MALADGARILQLTYADRRVAKSHVFHDFASLGVEDAQIQMPYSLWVVDARDGAIVIDTGFHVPDSYWVADAEWRTVPSMLREAGIHPLRVAAVVLTHYHFDHAGHVDLFPNAMVFASRREHEHWMPQPAADLRAKFVWPEHMESIARAETEGRLALLDGSSEISPGVTVIPAPGHTPGQVAVTVATPNGGRILASDAVHFSEQIDLGWQFFARSDAEQSDRSIAALRSLSERSGWPIIPGHDARVRERYPALAGRDFATVLA